MEKVSAKLFFTVMWRGGCQAIEWLLGLFGLKHNGWFARLVWGVIGVCVASILLVIASVFVYRGIEFFARRGGINKECPGRSDCREDEISPYLTFHEHDDDTGYVLDVRSGEKVLKNVELLVMPEGKDSLVRYMKNRKVGYFNKFTGKVVIEPKYRLAWRFCEGLAAIEEDGFVKFIDGNDRIVINTYLPYVPGANGYEFRHGYSVVCTAERELFGLIDRSGKVVWPLECSSFRNEDGFWFVRRDGQMAVLDKTLKPVMPFGKWYVEIKDDSFVVTMADHTIRKYDLRGNLINDFYITCVNQLEYEKDEIVYQKEVIKRTDDDGLIKTTDSMAPYRTKAIARLRSYQAGDGYEGLMTADGHIVTNPAYYTIEAIGPDLYLCSEKGGKCVLVNGKGEIVK